MDEKDLHRRVQEYVNHPDYANRLRRDTAKAYHPDKCPPHLRGLGEQIMRETNAFCDRLKLIRKDRS